MDKRAIIFGAAALGLAVLLTRSRAAQAAINADPGFYSAEDFIEDIGASFMSWTPPERAAAYLPLIDAVEREHEIPNMMLARLLYQESRFRPDIISGATTSSVGASGIAQFMPATAAELGINPNDPAQAIPAAGAYLRRLYDSLGNWPDALAAYNWGIGNVRKERLGKKTRPDETVRYVAEITSDIGFA